MKKFIIKKKIVIEKEEEVSYTDYIGFKVKTLRKEHEYNQEDFAKKIGVSRTTIVNIETGKQQLTINNLYKIFELLGIDSKRILPF